MTHIKIAKTRNPRPYVLSGEQLFNHSFDDWKLAASSNLVLCPLSIGINYFSIMDVKYRLESITETEYMFNYDFCYESIVPDVVSIQIGHTMKPLMDEDRIVVSVKVNIVHSETDTILATNAVTLTFGLSPIKEILSLNNNGNVTTQNTLILDTFMVAAIDSV